MAAALVSAALQLLATPAMNELRSLTSVEQDIKKLERNLESIHALLEDAEEKQMKGQSLKLWLRRVKEAAYDLEDTLDEWSAAKFLKSKAPGVNFFLTLKKKVLSLILCDFFPQISRRHNIAVQIKKINDELDEIAKEKDRYQLVKREIKQPSRGESTAFVDVSKLHGRDEVKKEIVSALLGENCMQTISIVGMGGLGKTALAQLIYDDNEVRTCFSKRIWVCVSDLFDQIKIARAILDSLDPNPTNLTNPSSLQNVLEKICEKITNTKFFLVLDDVWTEKDVDWEPFKAIFRQSMSGSRILMTTRKESVAKAMESFDVFYLEKLSDDVCWSIISQIALGKDKELGETLENMGKEIAKKCKGLPLAAKILGGQLRGKRSEDEWQNLLNSELWDRDDIFTPLLLSYYDLPSKIRPCFLYCVIFPKDYVMKKLELIAHWMAQGYLNSNDNNIEMESIGEEYFNYLASRSLFQDFIRDENGSIDKCKVHDVVYDSIKFLVKDEISRMEVGFEEMLDLTSSKARHLGVIRHLKRDETRTPVFPRQPCIPFIKDTVKLRSFVTEDSFSTNEASNLFKGGKCLRLLEVSVRGLVPKNLGILINLRYLKIHSRFPRDLPLPKALCKLHNLQFLGVPDFRVLPDGIGKLINLRHLSILYPGGKAPKGIARLTSLRTLGPIFVESKKNSRSFSIGDLENLDLLRGTVTLRLDGETVDMEELKRAKLDKKKHLKELILLLWVEECPAEDVLLQALNPPSSLRIRFTQ